MSTFYVRKDGSGTHTTITSAYMQASAGDTIDIGEGTFTESIEVFKNNLTFVGAGKDKTIVQGNYGTAAIQTSTVSSWTLGSNFFTLSGTAAIPAFIVGMSIGESGSAANSPGGAQITQIDSVNRRIYINKTFTNAMSSKIMKHWGRVGTFEVRASGFTMSGMKVIDGPNGGGVAANDQGAIYLGATNANANASKLTGTHSTGFNISNCELVADGDSAIAAESNAGVGNGTVTGCVFSGKTFVGQYAPSGGGNAVKQAVVFQSANLPITFTNNKLDVICGGMTNATPSVYGGNQIATIDAYGSIVTGNEFKGKAVNPDGSYFNMTGLALRMRGGNATASNNVIKGFNGLVTGGYLILPSYTNLTGKTIPANEVVINSNRFFKCTQSHVQAADKAPGSGALWASYWTEFTGTATQIGESLIQNGKANYQANSGSNITITRPLIEVTRTSTDSFVSSAMGKDILKLHSKVSSDASFSNESNWKLVNYVFKHESSSRRLVSSFRSNFSTSKKSKLKMNMKTGDKFELHKIIISKSDRSNLVLKRSEISGASDFDFTLLSDGPAAPVVTPSFFYLRDFSNPNSFGIDEAGNSFSSGIINNMLIAGTYSNHETLTFKAGYTYTIRFYIESLALINEGTSNPMLAHFDVYGASIGIGTVYEPELSNSITGVGYVERSFIGGGNTVTDWTWGIIARYCNLSISKVAIIETAP